MATETKNSFIIPYSKPTLNFSPSLVLVVAGELVETGVPTMPLEVVVR